MSIDLIKHAIQNKRLVEFSYHGNPRIAEPHVLGMSTNDREVLLTVQIGGYSSSGNLPDWRMFYLDEIVNLKVLEREFQVVGTWHNPRESDFKIIYEVVRS